MKLIRILNAEYVDNKKIQIQILQCIIQNVYEKYFHIKQNVLYIIIFVANLL